MINFSNLFFGKINKGFTVLEVTVAIFVLTVAVGGSFALIQKTLLGSALVQSKLTAAYLAQEGIELVRNIRDSNWLEDNFWDDGLDEEDWEIDYNDSELSLYSDRYLYIEGAGGFYSYPASPAPEDIQTGFKRKITISKLDIPETQDPTDYGLKVSVLITWEERGRTYTLEAEEHLYNWL